MKKSFVAARLVIACSLIVSLTHCNKKDKVIDTPAMHQSFTVVTFVSSDATIAATRIDAHLLNAWGMSFSPTGTAWISSEADHSSAVYNAVTGGQTLAAVAIPSSTATTGGSPTGQVFNSGTGFTLPNGNPARFIFAQTDGIISGWNGGTNAIVKVDRSGTSVYLGLAIGANGTDTLLYAADFKSGKIDVFNRNWVLQTMTFTDPSLPSGYSPFNIQNIGGQLYVMYAKVDPSTHEEMKGAGLGIVDVYATNGSFVKRLVTGGSLNAPWGIAQAPSGWLTGAASSTVILVGNFGDGHVNAYDASTGAWLGTLQSNGTVITIDGLWSISFAPSTATTVNQDWLFFAAGPADETKGMFGYITK
jgi:uncharacterized protein (TIGR03118 family)